MGELLSPGIDLARRIDAEAELHPVARRALTAPEAELEGAELEIHAGFIPGPTPEAEGRFVELGDPRGIGRDERDLTDTPHLPHQPGATSA